MTGTGLVFAGARVPVLGRNVISWLDDPRLRLKMPEDGRSRVPGYYVQAVVLHTTRGAPDSDDPRPQTLLPGAGPSTRAIGCFSGATTCTSSTPATGAMRTRRRACSTCTRSATTRRTLPT